MSNIAIFPGSFDPFTIGHQQIVERSLPMFSKLYIAIGINNNKSSFYSIEQRLEQLHKLYDSEPKIEIISYDTLTVDIAKKLNAHYILRGVRSTIDFEYERTIAEANRKLSGIETIFLISDPELAYISSSLVRELFSFGKDISPYLPK